MFLWISSEKPSMPMPVDWETELLAAGALGPGLVGNTGNPPPPAPAPELTLSTTFPGAMSCSRARVLICSVYRVCGTNS